MIKIFTLLLSLTFCFSASAEDNYDLSGRWGVGGGAGMHTIVKPSVYKDSLDEGFAGSLWGRYHLNSRVGFELAYTRLMFDYKPSGFDGWDPTADVVDFSVAYRAWPLKRAHLLVQLGLGYVRFTDANPLDRDDKYDDLAVKARIGGEYMIKPNLALAAHADYYYLNLGSGNNSQLQTLAPMIALTYYFGAKSFGDPDPTPAAPAPVVSGDLDGDTVPDSLDKCANTPHGQPVNEFGCAKTEKIEFTLNVQFASGSAVVADEYKMDLEKLAEFLMKYPTVTAEIEGHTDNTGSEKLNFRISQKRAEAIRAYLVTKLKVDKKRLTAKGYGPSQPVADNATAEGRLKNRRVVAHVQTEAKK